MPKSNKTSHVLSLLVNDLDAAEETAAAPQAVRPEPPPTSKKKPRSTAKTPKPTPPKSTPAKPAAPEKPSRVGDETVAQDIRKALEEALEKGDILSDSAPGFAAGIFPKPEPLVPASFSREEPDAPEPPIPTPEPSQPAFVPASRQASIPEPPQPEPWPYAAVPQPDAWEPATRSSTVYPSNPEDDESFCFNVMQALVEAKASKYTGQFGLCPCPRCRTDVVALALSRLPSKYVVATSSDLTPLLSVYEEKYNAAVVSQVMRACNRVAAKPRHVRG